MGKAQNRHQFILFKNDFLTSDIEFQCILVHFIFIISVHIAAFYFHLALSYFSFY